MGRVVGGRIIDRVDLHPEDLFDRARRGEASSQEVQRLHAHLESCPACRYEYTLARDCAEGAAALPGDEALLARVRTERSQRAGGKHAVAPGWTDSPAPVARRFSCRCRGGSSRHAHRWGHVRSSRMEPHLGPQRRARHRIRSLQRHQPKARVSARSSRHGRDRQRCRRSGRCAARDVRPGKIGRWRRSDSIARPRARRRPRSTGRKLPKRLPTLRSSSHAPTLLDVAVT